MNNLILLSIILLTTGCATDTNYVPNFTYKRDWNPETGEYTDVWKSCARTRADGGGDCDDWAICAADEMVRRGVPRENISYQHWESNTNAQRKDPKDYKAHLVLRVDFPNRGIEYWSNQGYHGKKGLMGHTLAYEYNHKQVLGFIERDKNMLTKLVKGDD